MPRKESSPELSSLAAEVLNDPNASQREKRLAASVLSNDETPGQAKRVRREVVTEAPALPDYPERPEADFD